MKIKVGWLDLSVSREKVLELLYSNKKESNPWWYSKVKISWDEDGPQNYIFIHGVQHYDFSGRMWYEFRESLSVVAHVARIIREIKKRRKKSFFVPFGTRSPELPTVVFENGDSLERAERLIDDLFVIQDRGEERIWEAVEGLKKTRSIVASKSISNIRKELEKRI